MIPRRTVHVPQSAASQPGAGAERSLSGWFVKALGVIFVMQLVVNAVRPTVSYRALDLGADAVQLGLIAAGFALLSLVFAIPIGRMIDRRGEMPFIISEVGLVTVVAFSLVTVDAVWALFVTQAVLGLGQVLTTVGMQALIANSGSTHRDSRFGAFTVIVSLGQFAGPSIAGLGGR
jgi:MFS family permease